MSDNLLKGIQFKCLHCGKNYNFKNNNGTLCFLCSTKKNSGFDKCNSKIIYQDDIIDIIKRHCDIHRKDFSTSKTSKIKLFVLRMEVDEENNLLIYYRDGSKSKIGESEMIF